MAENDAATLKKLQAWADGKATLKDVRGYSNEQLYAIARTAYFFFYQGKIAEARTLFQGLYAVNPLDSYFAKSLAVVEMAGNNPQGALAAYDVALKLSPSDPQAYVGRAEVKIALGQRGQALEDLRRAQGLLDDEDPLSPKVSGLLQRLSGR